MEALRLLDLCTGLVVVGLVADLVQGKQKGNLSTPQLPFIGVWIVWSYAVTILALGTTMGLSWALRFVLMSSIFAAAVIYGSKTRAQVRTMIGLLVGLGLFIAVVGIMQGRAPAQCIPFVPDEDKVPTLVLEDADGRECGRPSDCKTDDTSPEDWACENLGAFGTVTVAHRIKWRGQLGDPNELSVYMGAIIPLLIGFFLPPLPEGADGQRRRHKFSRFLLVGLALALVLYAVILTQSRGGQMVVGVVFMAYFFDRFGKKGIFVAAIFMLPVFALGGRDDSAADESTAERLELLYQGISLIILHPFRGVGVGQFADQVDSSLHLTAHNSYVLAAAELGVGGFFWWSGIVWTSLKIPIMVVRQTALSEETRSLARSLLMSFAGIAVGIFFLSFTYKQLLFVWFGLSGALYRIAKAEDPGLTVKVSWKDYVGVAVANTTLLVGLYVYTRLKGTG